MSSRAPEVELSKVCPRLGKLNKSRFSGLLKLFLSHVLWLQAVHVVLEPPKVCGFLVTKFHDFNQNLTSGMVYITFFVIHFERHPSSSPHFHQLHGGSRNLVSTCFPEHLFWSVFQHYSASTPGRATLTSKGSPPE